MLAVEIPRFLSRHPLLTTPQLEALGVLVNFAAITQYCLNIEIWVSPGPAIFGLIVAEDSVNARSKYGY